jgi:hypothetical protein
VNAWLSTVRQGLIWLRQLVSHVCGTDDSPGEVMFRRRTEVLVPGGTGELRSCVSSWGSVR